MLRLLIALIIGFGMVIQVQAQQIREYIVEAVVDELRPYVGQQIIYRFRVFTSATSPPSTRYLPPSFEGFWRSDMGPATSYSAQIDGQFYAVTEVATALVPLAAGPVTIEPATLILDATVFRPEQALLSQSITVEIQPLPADPPVDFRGAVGQFEMTAAIDRQVITQGEPIFLRALIRGDGNLEQLLLTPPSFDGAWRVFTSPTEHRTQIIDDRLMGEKIFEWRLLPTQPGDLPIPAITFTYFDPAALRFISTQSAEGIVSVSLPEVTAPVQPETTSANMPIIKPLSAVIHPERGLSDGLVLALWLIPPLGYIYLRCVQRRQSRRADVGARLRKAGALARAQEQLRRMGKDDPGAAVGGAIYGYAADKLMETPEMLTRERLVAALGAHRPSTAAVEALLGCLDQAEALRYGPSGEVVDADLLHQTAEALRQVDQEWQD